MAILQIGGVGVASQAFISGVKARTTFLRAVIDPMSSTSSEYKKELKGYGGFTSPFVMPDVFFKISLYLVGIVLASLRM